MQSVMTADTIDAIINKKIVSRVLFIHGSSSHAYTAGGAYASGEERIKGRIRSGLLADFLLVDRNLLTCPPEELLSARVLRTYVGGACVFRDPSF